jgi:two-component system OmpR family response regulator
VAKILLIEDDLLFAKELVLWLERDRNSIDHVDCLSKARDFLRSYSYEVLVLDWELPDGSGADFCKTLVQDGYRAPILMLTGRVETKDRITGLDSGAFDYVCKPCFPEEISARIRAILRRPGSSVEVITFGNTTIDMSARTIQVSGKPLKLSPTEFEILLVLGSKPGTILAPETLIARCGSFSSKLSRSSLKVYVSNIRKKYAEAEAACPLQWQDYGYVFGEQ